MGDRSGSREPKLGSLKKSKKNPGAPAGRTKRQQKVDSSGPALSEPPPPPGDGSYFDCGMAVLSRQFERDREKVMQRARNEGVCGILCWFSDIEKMDGLLETSKSNIGLCYFLAGIHPDNIERTNKKSHEGWVTRVEEIARQPCCLGILSGLNLTREIGTHFAQESLLQSACSVADKLLLPLVLHIAPDGASLDRVIELLRLEGWTSDSEGYAETQGRRKVILHDAMTACGADRSKFQLAIDVGFYFIITSAGLTDSEPIIRQKSSVCLNMIPSDRVLVGTDSPWRTPQNIPDTYLRTLRNEPANIRFIVEAMFQLTASQPPSLKEYEKVLLHNSYHIFGLESLADVLLHHDQESKSSSNIHSNTSEPTAGSTLDADKTVRPTTTSVEVEKADEVVEVSGIVLRKSKEKKNKNKNKTAALHAVSAPGEEDDVDEEEEDHLTDDIIVVAATETVTAEDRLLPPLPPPSSSQSSEQQQGTAATTDRYFGCQRCRCRLFTETDVVSHGIDATRTIFKVGEEGLCTAAVFLPCQNEGDLQLRTRLAVLHQTTIECQNCSCKLGKYSVGDATCPCGAVVHGPTARIITSKVDFFDGIQDTEILLARAKIEAEDALREDEYVGDSNQDSLELRLMAKRDKKKKKISRLDNRGNFSNFRNKSFVPNASRSSKKTSKDTSNPLESGVGVAGDRARDEDAEGVEDDDDEVGEEDGQGEDSENES